jgi:hypothetical protein
LLPQKDPNAPLNAGKAREAMDALDAAKERALQTIWKHLLDKTTVENIDITLRMGRSGR